GTFLHRRRMTGVALAAVAVSLWWQSAAPSLAQTQNALPAAPAFPGIPGTAVPASPPAVSPPVLPGQIGTTFEQAMLFGNECMKKSRFQEAAVNYQAAIKF